MNTSSLSVEQAKEFLAANPTVQWIDAFVLDMNGHPRGKRLRRDDLLGVAKSGMMLPASVFIMDPRGNCIDETGRLWSTGDPDYNFRILTGTLKAIPVNGTRFAQAVIVPEKDDPLDPRPNQITIGSAIICVQRFPQSVANELLDVGRRHAGDGSRFAFSVLQ